MSKTNAQPVNWPAILTIAGSDSSGGAGIQADLKTMTVLGCHGASVITALTAQNSQHISDIMPVPLSFLHAQLEAVLSDLPISAIKMGMLFSPDIIEVVAHYLDLYPHIPVVLDTVMLSKTKALLLKKDAILALVTHLLPRSVIATPNIEEAYYLAQWREPYLKNEPMTEWNKKQSNKIAEILSSWPTAYWLLKGGHSQEGNYVCDRLYQKGNTEPVGEYQSPYITTRHTHGTGCSLSSAIACFIAKGLTIEQSVAKAHDYVHHAISYGGAMGHGHGTLRHWPYG
jgi:hydroxymethylpyrimidine/phosphomethylpyrimidine kinase